jgi:hypothetical protein
MPTRTAPIAIDKVCARLVAIWLPHDAEPRDRTTRAAAFRADDVDPLIPLHTEYSFWQYPLGRGQTAAQTGEFLQGVLGY